MPTGDYDILADLLPAWSQCNLAAQVSLTSYPYFTNKDISAGANSGDKGQRDVQDRDLVSGIAEDSFIQKKQGQEYEYFKLHRL